MARPKKQDDATIPLGSEGAAGAVNQAAHASAPSTPHSAADAFAKIEAELAAIAPETLAPITVDLPAAVAAVRAAAPRIRAHRNEIVEQLPKHPIRAVDELETYADAAWYAHLLHTYSSAGPESAKALSDEATVLREGLLIAAEALAHRALLDADAVARIRKAGGHDLAHDLTSLAALFRDSWGRVSSKTAVEKFEVDRAAELGPAVLVATAAKKHRNTDTDVQRTAAFALLVNAYDACRRSIAYLRWKEADVDVIAPSLFKKRAGRKLGKKDDEPETSAGADPVDAASG